LGVLGWLLAKLAAADINDLPWEGEAAPGQTYKWLIPQYGLEICDVCGEKVNMGAAGIVNPRLGISVDCPLIAAHYMEHGSFSYAGSYGGGPLHVGRIDIPLLMRALELRLPSEPNDHQLPVPHDADSDLLANKEELAIGYRPFRPDQNRNEIPDGVELAKRCAAVVADLPTKEEADPNETYKFEHALDGLESCHICGQEIHMGGWEIINPKLGLKYPDPNDPLDKTFLPDLALHYMQHGSFDCYGKDHKGRVNIPRLLRVLELRFPYDPNDHQLPIDGNDLDGDLLADSEELAAGYNLYDPDQDNNLLPDGIELAKQCAEVIDELPWEDEVTDPNQTYKWHKPEKGLETCDICAATVNMGAAGIVNPRLGLRIDCPLIIIHYMEHGSFSYSGDIHGKGRIDIPLLARILEIPNRCGHLGTLYLPGDSNKDCIENFTDFADFADKWLQSTDPNQSGDDK